MTLPPIRSPVPARAETAPAPAESGAMPLGTFADLLGSRGDEAAGQELASSTAEMFNEHGLFPVDPTEEAGQPSENAPARMQSCQATRLSDAGPPLTAAEMIVNDPQRAEEAAHTSNVPELGTAPVDGEGSRIRMHSGGLPGARSANPRPGQGEAASTNMAFPASLASAQAAKPSDQARNSGHGAISRPALPAPRRGAMVPINVSLQFGTGGAAVTAAVSGLGAEERDQLERRIVEQLAQHGLRVGAVRVRGSAALRPKS